MGVLPPSGSQISMGRAGQAYNNVAPGGQNVSFGGSAGISLNAQIGRGAINTAFSATFGGRTTPFTY